MDAAVQTVELGDIAGPSCFDPFATPEDFAAFGSALPALRGRALFAFWLERWRDGRPPGRERILPEELGRLLSHAFLIEVEPSGRLRYRLVGGELASGLGYDSSGRYLDEVSAGFPEALRGRWAKRDALSVDQARPVSTVWTMGHLDRAWRVVTSLRLPLIAEGRVTHLLGYGTVA